MTDLARQELVKALPYARRFARALVGDQKTGDQLVAAALKTLMETHRNSNLSARQALYGLLVSKFTEQHAGDAAVGVCRYVSALFFC